MATARGRIAVGILAILAAVGLVSGTVVAVVRLAGTPGSSQRLPADPGTVQPDIPPAARTATAVPAATATLGDTVADGGFEFTVSAITCGVQRVGGTGGGKAATGRYCLVEVRLRNVGTGPRVLDVGIQRGYTADGVVLRPDSEAGLYANAVSPEFGQPIEVGGSWTGFLVFDVPSGKLLRVVELRQSVTTPGARVQVG